MLNRIFCFKFGSSFPKFIPISPSSNKPNKSLILLHTEESEKYIKESEREDFKENHSVTYEEDGIKKTFVSQKGAEKGVKITKDTSIEFS